MSGTFKLEYGVGLRDQVGFKTWESVGVAALSVF